MLLVHGTTELRADKIYECGYFQNRTPFLKLEPDPKLALWGASGFAFRDHPYVTKAIEKYCKQDLACVPWKRFLQSYSQYYTQQRRYDASPGLLFVVDIPTHNVDFPRRLRANWFVPINVDSVNEIPITAIQHIITLQEYKNCFKKYDRKIETPLEDLAIDSLPIRLKNTASTRWNRLVRKKV